MRVCVALEERFVGTRDGRVWTAGPNNYGFWQRYRAVFDEVCVVARVLPVAAAPRGVVRADGPGVAFAWLPYYVGPWQYLQRAHQVRLTIRAAVLPTDAVILRVGANVGNWVAAHCAATGQPYALEVVQDPYDAYAPGACRHRLRPFFRLWLTQQLRRQCRRACAAAYVTATALQQRYPAGPQTYTTSYSSIELPAAAFTAPRRIDPARRCFTLIMVGMLKQLYKAPDVLIDAVAMCVQSGLDLRLLIVGDGEQRALLERQAAGLGLAQRVLFLGQVPAGRAVRGLLDQADLFVLPSRQEGLPRAMIEAMARGLPCIGSTVGGIPELLPPDDLVPPGDAAALAAKIGAVLANPARRVAMATRNRARAADYSDAVLRPRRERFYAYVRDCAMLRMVQ